MSIMSRDLQPTRKITTGIVTYDCRTPARDGTTSGAYPPPVFEQHTWYLTAPSDTWACKLGASASVGTTSGATSAAIATPTIEQDDDDGVFDSDGDGLEDFTNTLGWEYVLGTSDFHYGKSLEASDYAEWTFTIAANAGGAYSIQATWPLDSGKSPLSDSVRCFVSNNGVDVSYSPFQLDQTQGTATAVRSPTSGQWWWTIANNVSLSPGTVTVRMKRPTGPPASDYYILADGMRLVLRNDVNIKSIERSLGVQNGTSGGTDVTAHVVVSVNLPE